MILKRSAVLLRAVLLLAILVLPLGTSLASTSVPRSSEAVAGTAADQDAARSEMPTDQIILKYTMQATLAGVISPASAVEMQRLSDAAGVPLTYVREMSGDAHVLRLPSRMPLEDVQAIADRLSALAEIEYAEPDAIMQHTLAIPTDPRYPDQWHYFVPGSGHFGINAPAAWDITTGSPAIVVADIDTGITNHIEFAGRTMPGYDFISDIAVANDGNGRDSDPSDPGDWVTANQCFLGSPAQNSSWHGTHTAGTIGAASNNGVGVAGINWVSKILPVRVLGRCGGFTSDLVDGMRWSAGMSVPGVPVNANPAKVLNLSLGRLAPACGTTEQNAISEIIAAGATIVVSAGNENANASVFSPGNCNGVITVAATDRNGSRAPYSNYGTVVEISAPGGYQTYPNDPNGVLSTLNTGTQGPVADTYGFYQGTSMAAPHVTGVVSLLYSRKPTLTPSQVLTILQNTATSFPGGSSCTTSVCGSGIVNAGAAVAAAQPLTQTPFMRLPLVLKGEGAVGINGRVTNKGAAATGIQLQLRFYNGSTWSTAETTTTDGDGRYRFVGAASLGSGQRYYVLFGPNTTNHSYVFAWYGPPLNTYTSGSTTPGGDFDIADVEMISPPDGAATNLPVTFTWQQRGIAADTYRVYLYDYDTGDYWVTTDLGNVGGATLGLPSGAAYNKQYYWWPLVFNGPDSYGEAFGAWRITFLPGAARSSVTSAEWQIGEGLRDPGLSTRQP